MRPNCSVTSCATLVQHGDTRTAVRSVWVLDKIPIVVCLSVCRYTQVPKGIWVRIKRVFAKIAVGIAQLDRIAAKLYPTDVLVRP